MMDRIRSCIAEAHRTVCAQVDEMFSIWAPDIDTQCQSPIEKILATAILLEGFTRQDISAERGQIGFYDDPKFLNLSGYSDGAINSRHDALVAQVPILDYRVDFVLRRIEVILRDQPIELRPIAIECDGHDFHERTKEQAARDRSRDRELVIAGYEVIRFTGSEIWRDPMACARQLCSLLDLQTKAEYDKLFASWDEKKSQG